MRRTHCAAAAIKDFGKECVGLHREGHGRHGEKDTVFILAVYPLEMEQFPALHPRAAVALSDPP
jgi:hypothetical protein